MGKEAGAPIDPDWNGLHARLARLQDWGAVLAAASAALLGAVAACRAPWRLEEAPPLSTSMFLGGLLAAACGYLWAERSAGLASPVEPVLPFALHRCRRAFSTARLGWTAALLWASACALRQDSFAGLAFGALCTAALFHVGGIRLAALETQADEKSKAQSSPGRSGAVVPTPHFVAPAPLAAADVAAAPSYAGEEAAPFRAAGDLHAELDDVEEDDLEDLEDEVHEEDDAMEEAPPQIALFQRREGETLLWEGRLRCEVAAGGNTASAHVAFCPPFDGPPQLEWHQLSGPAARIRVGQALPQGVRFDLRLAGPSQRTETVEWAFFARPKAAAGASPSVPASRAA